MEHEKELESRLGASCREVGLTAESITWLPAELSLRRFARVRVSGGGVASVIARVEGVEDPAGRPAGVPPEPPHEPIRALLETHGLPVPRRFGADPDAGIELLEDLGDVSLRSAAAALDASALDDLITGACELVPRLQRIGPVPGVAAFERGLDDALLAYKADLVIRYGVASRGREATPAEAAAVRSAFERIAQIVAVAPRRLSHRDFQSANLFVRDGALTMIDLQGAFLAPPEYDLVCLLRDSYLVLDDEDAARHGEAVRAKLPDAPDPDTFAARFDLLTLARKGKDHARFHYAAAERGDRRYLAYAAPTLAYLCSAARRCAERDPGFADLADLFHELAESSCAR